MIRWNYCHEKNCMRVEHPGRTDYVKNIDCTVPCVTHWMNKNVWMAVSDGTVIVAGDTAFIR